MAALSHRMPVSARTSCDSYWAQERNRHCTCIVKHVTPSNLSKKPTDIRLIERTVNKRPESIVRSVLSQLTSSQLPSLSFIFNIISPQTHFSSPNPTTWNSVTIWTTLKNHKDLEFMTLNHLCIYFDYVNLAKNSTTFIFLTVYVTTPSVPQIMYKESHDWMISK
jgi:hypothetical protein